MSKNWCAEGAYPPKATLEEFIERNSGVKKLRENLQANMDGCTNLSPAEKKSLDRTNMIMVRQFVEESGLDE